MGRERKVGGAISGGVFLIGLGMLFLTNWWWPGIMLVIGLSGASQLFFEGRVREAIGTFLFFLAIPVGIAIITKMNIPWTLVIAFCFIVAGAVTIGKALFLKD